MSQENRIQWLCKFLGVKEVYYGICESKELKTTLEGVQSESIWFREVDCQHSLRSKYFPLVRSQKQSRRQSKKFDFPGTSSLEKEKVPLQSWRPRFFKLRGDNFLSIMSVVCTEVHGAFSVTRRAFQREL